MLAIREFWLLLAHTGASVRSYARQQATDPASVSRYLNGAVLPADEFVIDLIDAVRRATGQDLVDEAEQLRKLHRAAQETQTSNWGATQQWKAREEKLRARAEAAEAMAAASAEEVRELRRLVEERSLRTDASPPASTGEPARVQPTRYWSSYADALTNKGWTSESVGAVDKATEHVINLLTDPTAPKPTPIRGTFVHELESGRTASAVGLIAKSIDAGYRLVIVLTGTTNVTRRQIQETIDAGLRSLPDTSGIVRLTDPELDYRRLAQNLSTLEFEKQRPDLPLNDAGNLHRASVRLMVVKKNQTVLRRLLNDLLHVQTNLGEIPTLILDMAPESHQEGSAIDRSLTRLVEILPRAQYVSYSSSEPMWADSPKDHWIVTQRRPTTHLDGRCELLDIDDGSRNPASRLRWVDVGDHGLSEALDFFVLTGAIKAYRAPDSFRHHRLLIACSRSVVEQEATRERIRALWRAGRYGRKAAHERLRWLLENDIRPCSEAIAPGLALPASFDELRRGLRQALTWIGDDPVTNVAGVGLDQLWKVVVAGAKATNEVASDGMTVLYLHGTNTSTSISRMLGLWYGDRTGYQDLVRLCIPRSPEGTTLHANLVAYLHAEQDHRANLERYFAERPAGGTVSEVEHRSQAATR